MSAPATVHVVDDDAAWRESAVRLLSAAGYEVVAYASASEFLDGANVSAPACILLDVRMPGLTGLQLQQRLHAMHRKLPVIFISGHGDIPTSVLAVKAGAEDFLSKPVETEVLLRAVEEAVGRDRTSRAAQMQLDGMLAKFRALNSTEQRILGLVLRGRLNKQIAGDLGLGLRTVKWHRHNLMHTLRLRSVAEVASAAERLGLLSADGSFHIEL